MLPEMAGRIHIAAALIDDGEGKVFLVRKRGTVAFMQAGGKIDAGETALQALVRELAEELDFAPEPGEVGFLGAFTAEAANEPGHQVDAELFHVRVRGHQFQIGAELEEAVWVSIEQAERLPLAPLTRGHVLPLARVI